VFTSLGSKGSVKDSAIASSPEAGGDLLGESFNFEGKSARGAIAFGLANTGGYSASENPSNYVKPTMIAKLPEKIPLPGPGPLESADETPSATLFYDGRNNLNKVTIICHVYANPSDCTHSSNCGWCGSSNRCISGTNQGPLENCVKSSYIFSAPFPDWNPQTRVINEQIGGVSYTVLNK